MPAPSTESLLDFERHFDAALAQLLAGLPLNSVNAVGDTTRLETPYANAWFELQGEAPAMNGRAQPLQRGGTGATRFDPVTYAGRLFVEFFLDRAAEDDTALRERITQIRGAVRALLLPSQAATALNRDRLPYYDITAITIGPTSRVIEEGSDLDALRMQWDITFAILADAWPA
jgi:hypothetical protein